MDIWEALERMKQDFDECINEEGYKEVFADVLEAESILIQFVCASLKEPCDSKYKWEHITKTK